MEEAGNVEHHCEVLLLAEQRSALLIALCDQARDRLVIREAILDGQSSISDTVHPSGPCVVVISYQDLAGVIKFVHEVRRQNAVKPILLVTPEQDTDLLLSAYQAGANDCISSTISPALLLAKVRVWQRWSHVLAKASS
jgi:DNA-binding response OmpR family regulator